MDSTDNKFLTRQLAAFTLPMAAFLALLALSGVLRRIGGTFWLDFPEYWIYPAQTIICGALLVWFWREYEFCAARRIFFAVAAALLVFALWIAPQQFMGFAPRVVGFNPEIFSGQPAAFWATIVFRFLRLVVVVPLVEEVFWRGFALRYFIAEKFRAVMCDQGKGNRIGVEIFTMQPVGNVVEGMAGFPPPGLPDTVRDSVEKFRALPQVGDGEGA